MLAQTLELRKNKKGFTLVELIVVIAIIAILSTVAVVGYTTFIDHAKQSKADMQGEQLVQLARGNHLATEKVTVEYEQDNYSVEFDESNKTFTINGSLSLTETQIAGIMLKYFNDAIDKDTGSLVFDATSFSYTGGTLSYKVDGKTSATTFTIVLKA